MTIDAKCREVLFSLLLGKVVRRSNLVALAGGKQFRLGTTYADVESARKMYLAARRVLVRVANGLFMDHKRKCESLQSTHETFLNVPFCFLDLRTFGLK